MSTLPVPPGLFTPQPQTQIPLPERYPAGTTSFGSFTLPTSPQPASSTASTASTSSLQAPFDRAETLLGRLLEEIVQRVVARVLERLLGGGAATQPWVSQLPFPQPGAPSIPPAFSGWEQPVPCGCAPHGSTRPEPVSSALGWVTGVGEILDSVRETSQKVPAAADAVLDAAAGIFGIFGGSNSSTPSSFLQ